MSDMILFDLDGTLTDSGPGITRCVQYALASFGIEEPDLEKLNCYVGPPLLESFMNFAGLGCEEAQQAITKYRERYEAEGIFENEVYEGIDVYKRQGAYCATVRLYHRVFFMTSIFFADSAVFFCYFCVFPCLSFKNRYQNVPAQITASKKMNIHAPAGAFWVIQDLSLIHI